MGRYDSGQKRRVLEAAVAVFADRGLEGATIRLVGQKAGVNSALIYYYFENKQTLFEEAIRLVFGDFLRMLDSHKRPFENARARIDFLVNGIFDYYETRRARMQLMMQVFNLHIRLLADIILDVLKQKEVLPLAVLQDGILRREFRSFSPLQLWWNLLGMCIFTIQAQEIIARLNQKKFPLDLPALPERKKQIVELLLSGLALPPKTSEAPRAKARGISGEAKRNCAEANPASPFGLRRDRLAIHPRGKPRGILAKANKG